MNKAGATALAFATPGESLFDAVPPAADCAARRGSDRRVHTRLTPVELPSPITARLKYGEAVTLVDLSAGGALVETSMFLRPDTDLVIELLDGRTRNVTDVVSRVLRSQVSGLQGGVKYRGACVFDRPFSEPLPRWDDWESWGRDHWATEQETRAEVLDLYRRVSTQAPRSMRLS